MAKQTQSEFRGRRVYPWETWADGKTWLLERGDDYIVSDGAVRAAAYSWAKHNGMECQTALVDEGIVVKFTPMPLRSKPALPRRNKD